jgi:transposase
LKDACAVGHRRPDLADSTIAAHRRRLDRELDRLLDLKPTDVEGSHLRATIVVTARDKLLVFLTRRDVEATNNGSERALRPSVIFRRVTNGFRSEWVYADLCSVVATGRLAGRTALAVIRDALAAPVPERTAARRTTVAGWSISSGGSPLSRSCATVSS